ncbi:hypothetical protein AKJ51_00800 [candidate division MSBL1 archaeon SCGC-AAA382A20]|uniref:Helicase HerA central domain-containing protein n=1 Tax=candidate division MSBL1 archaeon SCGC-AAA382A20 TaxID=1698280 RepID=A0A133VMH9_9EURY|nr:hypothetical protein AKJ51_00800 [candidate division MSBL1 archaeon SCGC-AAA382A20]
MPFGSGYREVKELCQKLKPLYGKQIDRIFDAYLLEDKDGREQIKTYLEALAARKLPGSTDNQAPETVLVPPSEDQAQGSYKLGEVTYAGKPMYSFGLQEKEWIQHVGVFGRTGAGKTNLGYLILQQLQRKNKPALVFDWKRNYRDLLARDEFKDVDVYTIGRPVAPFTFNPLIPPEGTDPKTWLKKLNEVIAHAYMLGNGVLYLLQKTLDSVYEEFGVYSGNVDRWPTFKDVLKKAKNMDASGRAAGWLSSTLRALSSLCFGDMGELVNRPKACDPKELLKGTAILELDALTQQDKVFFSSSLLLWIHHHRMQEATREKFKHAILIEEAHHLLSGERRNLVGGQSVMEITFREIREFGESLIILDQHPSQISMPALGNTYATICLNLKHSKDVNAMGQCMLLQGEEKNILGELEVGQAVVKLQGRASRPFLMEIPEFNIQKGQITDMQIREKMAEKIDTSRALLKNSDSSGSSQNSGFNLTSLEKKFLGDVKKHPESGIAARYRRLGISARQGNKVKKRLLDKDLIEESMEKTDTGRRKMVSLSNEDGK